LTLQKLHKDKMERHDFLKRHDHFIWWTGFCSHINIHQLTHRLWFIETYVHLTCKNQHVWGLFSLVKKVWLFP